MREHDDDDLQQLADRLAARIMMGMGARSRFALRTALEALDTDGIPGALVIQVPTKAKDYPDLTFAVGAVELTSRCIA